jgi:hypothetical protein
VTLTFIVTMGTELCILSKQNLDLLGTKNTEQRDGSITIVTLLQRAFRASNVGRPSLHVQMSELSWTT